MYCKIQDAKILLMGILILWKDIKNISKRPICIPVNDKEMVSEDEDF